jgi:hypothetical protein
VSIRGAFPNRNREGVGAFFPNRDREGVGAFFPNRDREGVGALLHHRFYLTPTLHRLLRGQRHSIAFLKPG